MSIKKSIEKTTKTTEKATAKNTFTFNESTGVLTLKLQVERTKSGTGLKAVHLTDVKSEKSEYKCIEFADTKGNTVRLYKTGFDYTPKVTQTKQIALDPQKLATKLDSAELSVLESILAKLQ